MITGKTSAEYGFSVDNHGAVVVEDIDLFLAKSGEAAMKACDDTVGKFILDRVREFEWQSTDIAYWRGWFSLIAELRLGVRKQDWAAFLSEIMSLAGLWDLEDCDFPFVSREKVPVVACDWLKAARYIFRLAHNPGIRRGEDPRADYGEEIGGKLQAAIHRMEREIDDPCIDNVRFADRSKSGDMRRYYRAKARGCCGFHDELVGIDGRWFLIGCNYGH